MGINSLINRLDKIGIKIEVSSNYPWVYLDSINGKRVTEKYNANHGFNIAWLHPEFHWDDAKEMFNLIRKYTKK
jgi:hypothetical protein